LLDFISRYWLEALFGLILTGLSFLVRRLIQEAKTTRKATSAVQTGIRCMLRDRIIHSYEDYIRQGYCPLAVRENTEEMHAAYKALGGNGAIDHIVTEMNELPTVRKEKNQ
jgi:hypothetical protein